MNKLCINLRENNYLESTNYNADDYYLNYSKILKIFPEICIPFVTRSENQICGPFIKVVNELAIKYGYRYYKHINELFLV